MSQSTPQVVTKIAQLRQALAGARRVGKKIGLVPTMGALHAGHLSLVRAAAAECDCTVVSIYVNPTQFGPGEDFAIYPRTLEADLSLLSECRTDFVFAPDNDEIYPRADHRSHATWVEVGSVAVPLEGGCRPEHFRGVATIVLKLFNIVQPDVAYFGQKDFQQALVIRRMVDDLNVPVVIRVCPIIREPDGLAMSSRNRYLSPAARQQALVLWKSLQLARELVAGGECCTTVIAARMQELIQTAEDARIDYVALVDPETLEPVEIVSKPTLAALAVKIENTRLIDNCLLVPKLVDGRGQ